MRSALTGTSLVAMATAAQAQEFGHDLDEKPLEEIIVLSSPLRSSINEIALGTTVLGRESILKELDGTIGQTLARQPGINSTFFGPGASRPIIRGLGGERIRILTNDISTFDVSTSSADHLVATEVATADQIEILRGAATLRYGQNAIGGVVNVYDSRIPRQVPEKGYHFDGTFAYSSVDDGITIGGGGEVALGGGFVLHVDGNYRETEDYSIPGFAIENPEEPIPEGVVENSFTETSVGTGGLSWVFENGYIGFSAGVQDGIYGLPLGLSEGEEEEEEEEEEEGGAVIDFDQIRVDFDSELRFDNGLIKLAKLRFGYADYEHEELEGGEVGILFENNEWELRAEAFAEDFEVGSGVLTGTFGVNFRDRNFAADGGEAFVPFNEQFQWGVFALGQYTIDNFLFELSGRVDGQQNETDDLGLTGTGIFFSENFTTFSIALSSVWEVAPKTSIGINLSRAERAPVAEELFSNGFHIATQSFEIGDPNLDTETALSAELSFKTQQGPLSVGFNLYYTDYNDFIFLSPSGEPSDAGFPIFFYQQADSELFGFEAELDLQIIDNDDIDWSFDAQADLARGQLTEPSSITDLPFLNPELVEEFEGLDLFGTTPAGDDLPFFPPFRVLIGTDFTYKPWYSTLRLEVQHTDAQDRVSMPPGLSPDIPLPIAGTVPTDAFTFFNVSYEVKPFKGSDNLTVFVRARNLNNALARSATSFLSQIAPLPGRDVRVGFNVEF